MTTKRQPAKLTPKTRKAMREYEDRLAKVLDQEWSQTPGCDAVRVVGVFLRKFGPEYAGMVLTRARRELKRRK